jgi:hypothetical protein
VNSSSPSCCSVGTYPNGNYICASETYPNSVQSCCPYTQGCSTAGTCIQAGGGSCPSGFACVSNVCTYVCPAGGTYTAGSC